MQYLADTNIYRNLVRGLTLEEVKKLAFQIRREEEAKGHAAGFPIVVAMELISHLRQDDPHREECYKALCLLFDHSKTYNAAKQKYSGTFFPPLNVVLPKYFFGENGKYLKMYSQIIELTKDLTETYDPDITKCFEREINLVREQMLFEKEEIRSNYENFIKSINNDTTDWEYFKKNNPDRKEWFKNLKSGKSTFLVAEGFMQRAFNIMDQKYERTDENFAKLADFYDKFFPAIAMNELLLEQLGYGTLSLQNVEDKKWNTINDISIIFGILYSSDIDNKVLITEDRNIQLFFQKNNMEHKILTLDSFKKLLGI